MNKFNKNWFLIGLFFLIALFSTYVNLIWEPYVISGGDIPFISNIRNVFSELSFTWSNLVDARGYNNINLPALLFHSFSYGLSLLGFSEANVINSIYFLFIFVSFLSAYFAAQIIFQKQLKPYWRFLIGVFYAFNTFTIYAFSSNWGYSFFLSLYPFLPLIFAFLFDALRQDKRQYLYYSLFFLILGASSFANLAFFVAFLVVTAILLPSFCFYFGIKIDKQKIKLMLFYYLLLFVVFSPFIILNFFSFEALSGVEVRLTDWLLDESMPLIDAINLFAPDKESYFPYEFPYFRWVSFIFKWLSLYPLAFVVVLLVLSVKQKAKRNFGILAGVFLVGMLISKLSFPFNSINSFIFNLPILSTLRSYQKIGIFMPFIISLILGVVFLGFSKIKEKSIQKIIIALSVIICLYPLTFYLGKYQVNVTSNKTIDFSYLVQVPQDYYDASEYLNNKKFQGKIMYLPLGDHVLGNGWVNYHNWKYIGSNMTAYLFKNPIFSPVNDLMGVTLGEVLEDAKFVNYNWLKTMLRYYSIEYVVFDKNVRLKRVDQSLFDTLVREGLLLADNTFGALQIYRVNQANGENQIRTTNKIYQFDNNDNTQNVVTLLKFLAKNGIETDYYYNQGVYRDYENDFIKTIIGNKGQFIVPESGFYKITVNLLDKIDVSRFLINLNGEKYAADLKIDDDSIQGYFKKGVYGLDYESEVGDKNLDFLVYKLARNRGIMQDSKNFNFEPNPEASDGSIFYILQINNLLPENNYLLKLLLKNENSVRYHVSRDDSFVLENKMNLLSDGESKDGVVEIGAYTDQVRTIYIYLLLKDNQQNIGQVIDGFSLKGKFDLDFIAIDQENLNQTGVSSPEVSNFEKISPTKYSAALSNIKDDFYLVFDQKYNPGWELTFFDDKGNFVANGADHFKISNEFNAWKVDSTTFNQAKNIKIVINYKVQDYVMYAFLFVCAIIAVLILDLLIFLFSKNARKI